MRHLIAFVSVLASATLVPGQANKGLTEEDRKCFAWFDTLGFPDLTKSAFVRVSTGNWFSGSEQPPAKADDEFAFLLKDEGESFTVFDPAFLANRTFKKTGPDTPEHRKVAHVQADLKKETEAYLERLRQPDNGTNWKRLFGRRFSERGILFLWARACAGKKLDDEARQLLHAAGRRSQNDPSASFCDTIAADMAHTLIWAAVEEFGEPEVSRKELLAKFQRIVNDFPKSQHVKRATETVALLEVMVAEDEARARRPAKPFKNLPTKEKVAELVFRLRDQNGVQLSQPGSCDIFARDGFLAHPKAEKSPAQQLVELGNDAVPQLLEVIEDKRFTRSVEYGRNFKFSHRVLTVGDCAKIVLHRIAGREFKSRVSADAWWQELQKKGEKQFLIDATATGTESSPTQANRLVKKYPDAALEAIAQGVLKCKDDWNCARLVAIAAKLPGDKTLAFLREQLKAPGQNSRVAAAAGLLAQGHEEGLQAMIKEWEETRPAGGLEGVWGLMIDFLAGCEKPEGIRALGKDPHRWPVEMRFNIVEALSDRWPVGYSTMGLQAHDEFEWTFRKDQPSPAVQDAIDTVLAAALHDEQEYSNLTYNSTFGPRVCDRSAEVLAKRWKRPDWFDIQGTLRTRDRQRLQLKNVWLTRQGKTPVPLPAPPQIERAAEAQMRPLLQRLQAARSPKDVEEPAKSLLAVGLPALPAVRETLASLKPVHPAHAEIEALTKRLACIVREVRFTAESATPPKGLKERIDGLVGKPLEATAVVDLVPAVIQELPPGITGIKLTLDREGDDTGIDMKVTLTTKKVSQAGSQKGWSVKEIIEVGKKSIHNSSGMFALDFGRSRTSWASCADSLRKAFAADPNQPLLIRLSCIAEGD